VCRRQKPMRSVGCECGHWLMQPLQRRDRMCIQIRTCPCCTPQSGLAVLRHVQEAELRKVAAKLGRMTAQTLNQLLDAFELPRGTGEEGHKVLLLLLLLLLSRCVPVLLAQHQV
jgi:hypothetical protein